MLRDYCFCCFFNQLNIGTFFQGLEEVGGAREGGREGGREVFCPFLVISVFIYSINKGFCSAQDVFLGHKKCLLSFLLFFCAHHTGRHCFV